MTDEFDGFAADYDSVLNDGLRITGDDKIYFARHRISWTCGWVSRLGLTVRSVLDFGCGTGESAPMLASAFPGSDVTGVDSSEASIDVARRKFAGPHVQFSSAAHLDRDRFDVIYVNGVFHHIPPRERPAEATRLSSALGVGGVLALWENNPWNPGTRWVMRRLPFDRDAIMLRAAEARRLARDSGLHVVATDYCFFFPRVLAAFRRSEPWLRGIPLGGQYLVLAVKRSD